MSTLAQAMRDGRPSWAQVRRVLIRPQFWFGLAVLVPWFAWYVLFAFRPIFLGLEMAFLKYNLLHPEQSTFVGLKNLQNVLAYDRFWSALQNSFAYGLLSYALGIPLALLLAWCLVCVKRGRKFYQFVTFLPVVVSMVAMGVLFRMLMDPQLGAFNKILQSVGLPKLMWVFSSDTAMISIVAVAVWKGLGFNILLFSTAMLNVPESLYDAARVDGAVGWKMFRHVTMPLIARTFAMISILSVMGGLQVYTIMVILGPGPGRSTTVLNQLLLTEAFQTWRFGFAAALALIMFVIILVMTIIQMRVLQPRWDY